jgi:hypothetical protein
MPSTGRRCDLLSRLVVLVVAATLVPVAQAATVTAKAPPKLQGTIGPGFTISPRTLTAKQ